MKKILPHVGRIGFSVLIALTVYQLELSYFEAFLYDLRLRSRPQRVVSPQIVLVSTEYSTVEKYDGRPTLGDHARLLEQIFQQNPLAVIYTEAPNTLQGADGEGRRFAEVAQRHPHFYVHSASLPLKGQENSLAMDPPFEKLNVMSGVWSTDSGIFADDGVTRRAMYDYRGVLLLQSHVAALVNPEIQQDKNVRGLFRFINSRQVYVNFSPENAYPRLSFEDVIGGKSAVELSGKIVVIGSDLYLDSRKYVYTPLNRDRKQMLPHHELYANLIDTFIRNDAPVLLKGPVNLLLILIFAVFTAYAVLSLKPGRGLLVLLAAAVSFCGFSWFMFWPLGYWVLMSQTILAIFMTYYLFIPYRLIVENRKSWEYQRKNELLMQVEELKSNFLSMMSHDLKTPLARIRGMADVIKNDREVELSADQKEAVQTIRRSSEDLTNLISSILNFGRIESESIKLHLKSRDINQIIQGLVEQKRYLAEEKQVEILFEPEPLFPIKVDEDLIRQVFSNLLENAIKYSPEKSKILITTEESADGEVSIQVADQGFGISEDDIENIFMKFFRSKDANTTPIQGSGLGLYLAKYFVDLHGGRIEVDSAVGQGSTFSVYLKS